MAFTEVPVRGTVRLSEGEQAGNAAVLISLNTAITDGSELIAPSTETALCDGTGAFAITLIANDDPSTQPVGSTYSVRVRLDDVVVSQFSVVIPASGAPAGVELFSLARLPNPALPAQPYVSQILAGTGVGVSPSGGEGVVTVSATGGGAGQPWIDRAPAGDVTVPDHGSIVVKDYYTPSGTLTLEGDAVLSII